MEIAHTQEGPVQVFTVQGRVDARTAGVLEQALLTAVDDGARQIVVDCAALDYLSSAGLRALLLAAKQLGRAGGTLALAAVRDEIREVLDISGFSAIFPVYPTRGEAIAAGRGQP